MSLTDLAITILLLLMGPGLQVVPGLLSVRQVTGVLQQHMAQSKCPDSTLQYPQMLEVLCECAVLLRQQIQRKLAGPWVNITEASLVTVVNFQITSYFSILSAHKSRQ